MVKSKRTQFVHTPINTSDNQQIQMQKKVTTESMTHNPIKKIQTEIKGALDLHSTTQSTVVFIIDVFLFIVLR